MPKQSELSHDHITKLCRELIRRIDATRKYMLREATYTTDASTTRRLRATAMELSELTDDAEEQLR